MSIVAERQHSSITRYARMRAGGTPLPVVGRNKKAATFQRLLCDPGGFGVITFNALIYKDLEK